MAFALHTMLASAATSKALGPGRSITTIEFVAYSNITSALLVFGAYCTVPEYLPTWKSMKLHNKRIIGLCLVSELTNVLASLYFTYALQQYDNEGIIEAVRAGLHQTENIMMTFVLYRGWRFGRRPEDQWTKFLSCALILSGLYLLCQEVDLVAYYTSN